MIKRFENFDSTKWKFSTQSSEENLMNMIPYIKQLNIVLKDIQKGVFIKSKLNELLLIIENLNIDILPSNITEIVKEHRKDFYAMSKVVNKFTIKKRQYLQKVEDSKTLKDWLISEIEKT